MNMSPSADYIAPDLDTEYSIGLHLYLSVEENGNVTVSKKTFTMFRAEEDVKAYVTVRPVDHNSIPSEDEKRKIREVYNRFSGNTFEVVSDEYII